MPILGALIAGFFFKLYDILLVRLGFNGAVAVAFVATFTAAFLAVRAALAGVWALMPTIIPADMIVGLAMIAPGNLSTCITACVMVDVTVVAYRFWLAVVSRTAGLIKA